MTAPPATTTPRAHRDVLLALQRCPGVDTTDQNTGETFRDLIASGLRTLDAEHRRREREWPKCDGCGERVPPDFLRFTLCDDCERLGGAQ